MRESVERMDALAERFGVATCGAQLGQMLMLEGQHEEARRHLDRGLAIARAMHSDILEFHCHMALAWSWLDSGDQACGLEHLRTTLTIGSRRNYMNCHPLWLPEVMSRLFAAALEAGIETDYVRRFITHRNVVPDSPEVAGWPWPIRIYTLGHFRVWLDGQPIERSRKVQRRVLNLLQAIVAFGGEGVGRERLVEALWPDAEGDAARDAFEVTLHRLRKLLGRDDAVSLALGRVSLNPEIVWVDSLAFDRIVNDTDRFEAERVSAAKLGQAFERGLRLYAGHFLAHEDDLPCMLACRERLRSRFQRLTLRAAECDESSERVISRLRRALELEPGAETLVRALMSRLAEAGRYTEAQEVYRRCERLLAQTLGARPATETVSLHTKIARSGALKL